MGADNTNSRNSTIDVTGSAAEQHQLYAFKKIRVAANDLLGSDFQTPEDFICRAIMVNTAGDVELKLFRDDTYDVISLATEVMYPMRVKSIRGSGTTAVDITLFG